MELYNALQCGLCGVFPTFRQDPHRVFGKMRHVERGRDLRNNSALLVRAILGRGTVIPHSGACRGPKVGPPTSPAIITHPVNRGKML